ncbi:hypothetical protein YC2023_002300 [Brassica napus]
MILYDCETEALSKSIRPGQSVPLMIKWRYCPELVQFHGFRSVEVLLDTPRERRFCQSLDQSVEACQCLHDQAEVLSKTRSVQSTPDVHLGFWPSPLRSTSCFSPRTL